MSVAGLSMVLVSAVAGPVAVPSIIDDGDPKILVFSRTAGFRHDSIPDGIKAIQELGAGHFSVDATEDAATFTSENLAQYQAVVFLNTTGDILNDEQQRAFEGYIQSGRGYVGIHAAADTEYDWPWYGRLVGANFKSHPRIQPAVVVVDDRTHPATRHLPARWQRVDEWYNYKANPRKAVHVLATLDTASYEGSAMPGDHPIAWCQSIDGGRAFYTGGGHTKESYAEPMFRQHLLGAILWAINSETENEAPTPKADADNSSPRIGDDQPDRAATSARTPLSNSACCPLCAPFNAEQIP